MSALYVKNISLSYPDVYILRLSKKLIFDSYPIFSKAGLL